MSENTFTSSVIWQILKKQPSLLLPEWEKEVRMSNHSRPRRNSYNVGIQTEENENELSDWKFLFLLGKIVSLISVAVFVPIAFGIIKGLWGYVLFYCGATFVGWVGFQFYASVEDIAYVAGVIYAALGFINGLYFIIPKVSVQVAKHILSQRDGAEEKDITSYHSLATSQHSIGRSDAQVADY